MCHGRNDSLKIFYSRCFFTSNAFSLFQPYLEFYLTFKDQNSPCNIRNIRAASFSTSCLFSVWSGDSVTALGFPNWAVGCWISQAVSKNTLDSPSHTFALSFTPTHHFVSLVHLFCISCVCGGNLNHHGKNTRTEDLLAPLSSEHDSTLTKPDTHCRRGFSCPRRWSVGFPAGR